MAKQQPKTEGGKILQLASELSGIFINFQDSPEGWFCGYSKGKRYVEQKLRYKTKLEALSALKELTK